MWLKEWDKPKQITDWKRLPLACPEGHREEHTGTRRTVEAKIAMKMKSRDLSLAKFITCCPFRAGS